MLTTGPWSLEVGTTYFQWDIMYHVRLCTDYSGRGVAIGRTLAALSLTAPGQVICKVGTQYLRTAVIQYKKKYGSIKYLY